MLVPLLEHGRPTTAKLVHDTLIFDARHFMLVLIPVGLSGKHLHDKYQGPYKIIRQLGSVDYLVRQTE